MTNALAGLSDLFQQTLLLGPLAFARALGAFFFLPLIPESIPRHIRLALPASLWPLLFASPHLQTLEVTPGSPLETLAWLLAEFALGAVITLPAGIVFWAAQSAGELVDIKTGANNNATFGTGIGTPEGPAQILLFQLAVLAFLAGGGLLHVVDALLASFEMVPLGSYDAVHLDRLPVLAGEIAATLFSSTFLLFGPLFALFLIVEFGIGVAGKMSPQLQIGMVTAPAKGLVFAFMALALLAQGTWFNSSVAASLSGMLHVLEFLGR